MTSVKYPGSLGKPSRPKLAALGPGLRALLPPAEVEAADKKHLAENMQAVATHEMQGMRLLLEHYKLDPKGHPEGGVFFFLALHLARDHVPFFRNKKATRSAKAGHRRFALLEIDICLRLLAGDKSASAAIRYLSLHQAPWNHKNSDVSSLARQRRDHSGNNVILLVKAIRERLNRDQALPMLKKMRRIFSQSNSSSH